MNDTIENDNFNKKIEGVEDPKKAEEVIQE